MRSASNFSFCLLDNITYSELWLNILSGSCKSGRGYISSSEKPKCFSLFLSKYDEKSFASSTLDSSFLIFSTVGTTSGTAKEANIDVIYYYKKKAVTNYINITVKYLDIDTNKPVSNNITLRVELNKNYSTKKLDKDPKGYKFDSVNGDTEGTATEDKEVIYYYKKIKEVKPAKEVPNTGDNIVTLISTFIVSLTLMIVLLFIKKKQKVK